ncbi:MAG: DnaJ-domain-containing protein 1 [Planctomycetaceae bacterium]|jgi:DnaJ-domain-containing protein 1
MGGPVGAGIGAVIGGAISECLSGNGNEMDALMAAVSCFLGRFASETGTLGHAEREFIADICDQISTDRTTAREEIIDQLPEWTANDELFNGAINAARENEVLRSQLLSFVWQMASRDNVVEANETAWINGASASMGASSEELLVSMIPYQRAEIDDEAVAGAREALGVTTTATQHEIKQKYKELSRKHHPDTHSTANETLKELRSEVCSGDGGIRHTSIRQSRQLLGRPNRVPGTVRAGFAIAGAVLLLPPEVPVTRAREFRELSVSEMPRPAVVRTGTGWRDFLKR